MSNPLDSKATPQQQFDEALGNLANLTQRMCTELRAGGFNDKEIAVVINDNVIRTALSGVSTIPNLEEVSPAARGVSPQEKYRQYMGTDKGKQLGYVRARVLSDVQSTSAGMLSVTNAKTTTEKCAIIGAQIMDKIVKVLDSQLGRAA